MSRIETIKKVAFPPEECPCCGGDDPESIQSCEHCNNEGTFVQRLCSSYEPPVISDGERLVAYLDVDYWSFVGTENKLSGETSEIPFPFDTNFAMASHFRTLGFTVIT